MNTIFRIEIYYNEGTTRDGKKYKVPHTCSFGYDCTVQLNSCKTTQIQFDNNTKTYFLVYDARKAGMKLNDKGYLTLHITD